MLRRYFDHAATAHPRPDAVRDVILWWLQEGGTYGRSAYPRVAEVSRRVEAARESLAEAFGVGRAERVIFTPGATWSLNLVLRDRLRDGGRVLVSPLEHNAVMRPLSALAAAGVRVEEFPAGPDGRIQPEALTAEQLAGTTLAVVNQLSNVNGVIQPLAAIRQVLGEIPLLVDAAQSAGKVPLQVDRDNFDYVAISGHKGLLGLPGCGLLLLGPRAERLQPLAAGGTGSRSEAEAMPEFLPDALEAGTPNIPGILAMAAGLAWRRQEDREPGVRLEELRRALDGLPGVRIHAARDAEARGPLFSLNIEGISPSDLARRLSEDAGLDLRSGLHCAPRAHRFLGTLAAGGTVRIAPGPDQPEEDFACLYEAMARIAGKGKE